MMCIFRVTNSLNPPLSFSHGRRYEVMAIIFPCGRVLYAYTGMRGNSWRLWLRICKYGQIAYVHLHIEPWFRGQAAFAQGVRCSAQAKSIWFRVSALELSSMLSV